MTNVDQAELAPVLDEGFRPATAEKVYRLLGVLRELQARRDTADRYTLKGGTALNVFHLEDLPRLSVDIDLMATGFPQAEPGSDERDEAMESVKATLSRSATTSRVSETATRKPAPRSTPPTATTSATTICSRSTSTCSTDAP